MRIECSRKDDVTIVAVEGELDVATAPALQKRVKDMIEDGQIKLILDFSELAHITSSGLAVLAFCLRLLKPNNGRIAVAEATGIVKEVIEVWVGRNPQVVPTFATVEDALKSFATEK
jgi:anti-sigma B factor antagonist